MDYSLKSQCNRIIRAYGEPFLQFIFALDGENITPELLSVQDHLVLDELQSVASKASYDVTFETEISFNAMLHFLPTSDRQLGRAALLRRAAKGDNPPAPSTDDKFLQQLFDCAAMCWPGVLLLRGYNDSFHRLGVSLGVRAESTTAMDAAARALLADPSLGKLFPSPRPDLLRLSPSAVSCEWTLSIDPGGTVSAFAGAVIAQMLMISAVRLESAQLAWTLEHFWNELATTVVAYRDLAEGIEAKFPVVVGLGGLQTPELSSMRFEGGHTIRKVSAVDTHLLGRFGLGSHTVTLEIPTKLMATEFIPPEERTERLGFRDATKIVERELDAIRLALLTGTKNGRRIPTTRYFTRFLNPRSPGSAEIWSTSNLEQVQQAVDGVVSQADLEEIRDQHRALISPLKKIIHVDMPVRRLLQAAGNRSHPEDALVDAFVAIEALLNPGSGKCLTERLTSAIAALLQPNNPDGHEQTKLDAKDLYDLRSMIVHGNRRAPANLHQQARESVDLACRIINALCLAENQELRGMKASTRNKKLLEYTSTPDHPPACT
ncbi:HEPN domain-containing protein [Brevibacterium zhoupengii]|uniref:HEPN domain-containing protein n=1 Tax=Brevibacterium zhoupengii TaxID=2898795 RepID=UPI001E3826E9|nr:HEPN domain-containing protein [Brevibacterium zhoupengii]